MNLNELQKMILENISNLRKTFFGNNFEEFYHTWKSIKRNYESYNNKKNIMGKLVFLCDKLAVKYFKYLGAGASRIVFEISDSWVLKVAKNVNGMRDNALEVNSEMITKFLDLFPKFGPYDKNFIWIVQENVYIFKYESELKQFLKFDFHEYEFNLYLNYCIYTKEKYISPKEYLELLYYDRNESTKRTYENVIGAYFHAEKYGTDTWKIFISNLKKCVEEFNLGFDDVRINNIGLVERNGKKFIVLPDSGSRREKRKYESIYVPGAKDETFTAPYLKQSSHDPNKKYTEFMR